MAAVKYVPWRCGTCDRILGLRYVNGTLVVKYKDLVAWVTGNYRTVCRFCKTINEIETQSRIEDFVEVIEGEVKLGG